MKHIRPQLVFVICSCLVLLPCAPMNVRAQQAENGKKIFDSYSTGIGMAYPAAGAVYKATGEMLDLFGYFGKNADPVGEAIKRINERLDILEKRVSDLETRVRAIENEVFRTQNMARIRLLQSKQDALKLLGYKLQQKPVEKRDKLALAKEAEIIASGFLVDPDLWMWSDMRDKDGVMSPPDFKPLPALEYYVVALVGWVAAIDNATDGDYEFVKRTYGRELRKHIAFLSVRPGWKDQDDPETLPENIRVRVSCTLEPLRRQSNNRKCQIEEWCRDQLVRVSSTIEIREVIMPLNSDLCNVPPGASARGSEDELERMYGTEVMEKLAEKLVQLKDSGTVRTQFTGTFDPSTQTAQFLYAVKPNGDLLWYMHRAVTTKTGVLSPAGGYDRTSEVVTPAGKSGAGPVLAKVYGDLGSPAGRARTPGTGSSQQKQKPASVPATVILDPRIALPPERLTLPKFQVTHFLDGPKRIGTGGWQNFREVIPAGLSGIYALTQEGVLKWYRHDGFLDGSVKWAGSTNAGRGWGNFKQIIPMGDGIIYAITQDGKLLWYKHNAFASGAGLETPGAWDPLSQKQVATGWDSFKHVFGGGEGVIYAVTQEGNLLWHKHLEPVRQVAFARNAKERWEGPLRVGTGGWQNFKMIFSPGEGVIYALKPTGELLWYRHDGYKDGSVRWQSAVQIAADWKDFLFVFSRMTGTWTPPVVR